MRGCLFTVGLGVVALAVLVTIGLPKVYAGALTGALTAAGLRADDLVVTVASDPPTDLLGLRADTVRVTATDATFRDMRIGSLGLTLRDVSLVDRTAASVEGTLRAVMIPDVASGGGVSLPEIRVTGTGDALSATTTVPGRTVTALVADAVAARLGQRPSRVTLAAPNRVSVVLGATVTGTLDVTPEGDLVVIVPRTPLGGGTIVLLRGGTDLPMRLTGLVVTPAGDLRLTGDLEVGILG